MMGIVIESIPYAVAQEVLFLPPHRRLDAPGDKE
jgi:hypothetical protein